MTIRTVIGDTGHAVAHATMTAVGTVKDVSLNAAHGAERGTIWIGHQVVVCAHQVSAAAGKTWHATQDGWKKIAGIIPHPGEVIKDAKDLVTKN